MTFSSSDGSGKPGFRYKTSSTKTYPPFPEMDAVAEFGPELVAALKRLGACITERVERKYLRSLRLEGEAGRYKLSATDFFVKGYIKNIPGPKEKLRLKLPPSLALDLMRLKAGEVTLLESSKFMGARFGIAVRTSVAAMKVKRTSLKLKGLKRLFSIWLPSDGLRMIFSGSKLFESGCVNAWLYLSSSKRVAQLKIVAYPIQDSAQTWTPFTGEFLSHDVMLEVNPEWFLNFFSVCERDLIRFDLLTHKDSYIIRLSGCQDQRFYFRPFNVFGLPELESEE